MKKKDKLELTLDHNRLNQLSKEELVDIVLTLACQIEQLFQEIERLKLNASLDSRLTSKPPSHDLLKKSEQVPQPSPPRPETSAKKN
jgi:transposase